MSNCKYCGSVLKDGQHTDKFVRSWVEGGKTHRPHFYRVWSAMKTRCTNPNHNSYKYYGARGFKVCEEWLDYAVFRQWMIDQGFKPGLKVDRIDNDIGYFPWNCRLATDRQQMQNRRLIARHKHGRRYANTELTDDDVLTIVNSSERPSVLAARYDIHPTTVTRMRQRHAAAGAEQ